MKYRPKGVFVTTSVNAVTGSQVGTVLAVQSDLLHAWLPSTWPAVPASVDAKFVATLKTIFEDSILLEIRNVISDAKAQNGGLEHRGHVVAIALMCALDAVGAYAYRPRGARWGDGTHMVKFIEKHFPPDYRPHAKEIVKDYRNSHVHSWNLFAATLYPGNDPIRSVSGTLSFGLLNFHSALESAVVDFLGKLATDAALQKTALERYEDLRRRAR